MLILLTIMKKTIVLIILLWQTTANEVFAQNDLAEARNFIYFSASPPLISGFYSASYERNLLGAKASRLNFSLQGSIINNMGYSGTSLAAIPVLLLGKHKHYFESNLGMIVYFDGNSNENAFDADPVITIGYRKHTKGSNTILRAGVGYPYLLYLSFGFAF
jgi:hypothetical protein